jgi:FixJ family two-component response regulator
VQAYATPGDIPPLPLLDDVVVLITDYEMPGEDGLAFAKRFHGSHPGVPVIMVTGCCGIRLEHEDATADFLSLRCKPIDYEELHQLVQQAQRRVQCKRPSTS